MRRPQRDFPSLCVLLGALACAVSGCSETAKSAAPARLALPGRAEGADQLSLPAPMPRGDTFRRGLVLGPLEATEDEDDFKRSQLALLDRAVALGATDLQLVLRWLQTDYHSVEIAPFDTVRDELLTWVIDQAKRRKLRVLLTTRLGVENEGERAARKLKPENWEHWWWSYRRLVLHYARIAATRKAAMYSIGSELSSTEAQTDRWRTLIKDVRKIYKGKLTYFATADSFDKVAFWDSLDLLGIAVDQDKARSEEQLRERLEALIEKLGRSAKVKHLGYVIAEHGCGTGSPDAERQLLCQRALYQSFRDESALQGVYVRPTPEPVRTARDEKTHSATDVVRLWYGKSKS